jgi:hypothetical protein
VSHVGLTGATQLALVGVDGGDSRTTDQLNVAALVVFVKTRN